MKIVTMINHTVAMIYPSSSYGMNRYGYGTNIDAAIISKQDLRIIPVQSLRINGPNPMIDIASTNNMITLRFNTISSQINTIQKHHGIMAKTHKANFMAEPDILVQNIQKPVIQNVREIIQPYRKVFQEIRPVQEKIETVISKGTDDNGQNHHNDHTSSSSSSLSSIPVKYSENIDKHADESK